MKKIQWKNLSLSSKILLEVAFISILMFSMNVGFYFQINNSMKSMDSVYASNVEITQLRETLDKLQNSVYQYLKVKSSDALMDYYRNEADYRDLLEKLNNDNKNNSIGMSEKTIRRMSETYLLRISETVQAKRGRNVEKYKAGYEDSIEIYGYILAVMDDLNNQLFKNNNQTYGSLREFLKYLEASNTICMLVIVVCGLVFLIYSTKEIFTPLQDMAETAKFVGEGNFHIKMPAMDGEDELGTVTRAFNKMVENLGIYMIRIRESMEKEHQMMEKGLLMENHLKEAQLKFLQSQINPHFLFNSLNAGVQLAMMEDADKTGIFLEKMAYFFRYNVKKGQEDATLEEELEAVDNYIYILNVRFAGDIHFTREIIGEVENIRIPSMILQPIVENAVNHGIRDIEWEGKIHLKVESNGERIKISIKDNGKGMTKEQIEKIYSGKISHASDEKDSTGIGMNNVFSRLELYYECKNLITIQSEGENQGTEVILEIPINGGNHVQNFISR